MTDKVAELSKLLRFAEQLFRRELESQEIVILAQLFEQEDVGGLPPEGLVAQERQATLSNIMAQMSAVRPNWAQEPDPWQGPSGGQNQIPNKFQLDQIFEILSQVVEGVLENYVAGTLAELEPKLKKQISNFSNETSKSMEKALIRSIRHMERKLDKDMTSAMAIDGAN